jgi:hypothetical protein
MRQENDAVSFTWLVFREAHEPVNRLLPGSVKATVVNKMANKEKMRILTIVEQGRSSLRPQCYPGPP